MNSSESSIKGSEPADAAMKDRADNGATSRGPAKNTDATAPRRVQTSFSRGFGDWLIRHRLGLVASTYQSDQVVFIGVQAGGLPVVSAAALARPTGLAAFSQRIYVGCDTEIWRLEKVLASDELANDMFDRLYAPRNMQSTGDIDIHELAVEPSGRIIFANTKYSCVATISTTCAFKPIWKPKFISRLAPEDRCHLNGLAMENGKLHYVTACSTNDVVDGWRDNRQTGGVLIDVETDALIAHGLSMPHSPRVHGAAIYLLESGRGALVRIDRQSGKKEDVALIPGFGRGLAFRDNFAIVTVSLPRWGSSFEGLAVAEMMKQRGIVPWRGLQIIDLRNGDVIEWLRFEGPLTELFDVAIIPEIRAPRGLSPGAPELKELVRGEAF